MKNKSDKHFNKLLGDYYNSFVAPEELQQMIPRRRSLSRQIMMVASFMIIFFGAFMGYREYMCYSVQRDIADEIRMNHSEHLPIDFAANNLLILSGQMDRLDFPLTNVRQSVDPDYSLLGGRYCSIKGYLAAQLRFLNKKTGKVHTAYVTKIQGEMNNIRHNRVFMNAGVQIQIEKNNGLLIAHAED